MSEMPSSARPPTPPEPSFFLARWNSNFTISRKLMVMTISLALGPLAIFAFLSLRSYYQECFSNHRNMLSYVARSILRLCEAQEALTRLHNEERGKVDGVTGATVGWPEGKQYKSLQQVIREIPVPGNGDILIFDGEGRVQIFNGPKNIYGARGSHQAPPELVAFVRSKPSLRAGETVTTSVFRKNGDNGPGQKRLAAVGYFPAYDWFVEVSASESEILVAYYQSRNYFMVVLGTAAVLVFVLTLLITRDIMLPIRRLTTASSQISQGDFSVRLPERTAKDEVGLLTLSFKRMVDDLTALRDELITWNVTLERKVEHRTRELANARDRIVEAEKLASLGKMAAMVAHEINNPLSGVLSYLRLAEKVLKMEKDHLEHYDDLSRQLGNSASEVKRVGEIVRNLLMFAKRSFGDFGIESLNTVVAKSVSLVKHGLDMKSIHLELSLDTRHSDELFCDSSSIEQLLVALMVNSVDALEEGGQLTITTVCSAEEEVSLTICDTGSGIAKEDLPHVFEPFFTNKQKDGSIGMGLSVVYGVVQSHYGTIAVDSEVGQGTCFSIKLPRTHPQTPPQESAPGEAGAEEGEGIHS